MQKIFREFKMLENKADDIAYCGLYCVDCPVLGCEIADLAGKLKEKLDRAAFGRVAAGLSQLSSMAPEMGAFRQYPAFYEVLSVLQSEMRCEKRCKSGGGSGSCSIRLCCTGKKIEGCWQCPEFEACDKLAMLRPVHEGRLINNLKIIRDRGVEAFIQGPKEW
jgi:hypothetical protein